MTLSHMFNKTWHMGLRTYGGKGSRDSKNNNPLSREKMRSKDLLDPFLIDLPQNTIRNSISQLNHFPLLHKIFAKSNCSLINFSHIELKIANFLIVMAEQ
jgi:hypothetical protein